MSDSGSALRRQALRGLSRAEPAAHSALHEQVLAEAPDLTRDAAKGRALALERSSHDGAWRYRAARPMAGHIAAATGGLLDASPDPAATLALAGISHLAAARASSGRGQW